MKQKLKFSFNSGQALWQQRYTVYEARPRLEALAKAVDRLSDSGLSQYAQLFAITIAFKPSLIVELGRGWGNSTAVLTEASNRLPHARKVLSFCLSDTWQETVSKRVAEVVERKWFVNLDARIADILEVSLGRFIRKDDSVLFFWDAHSWAIAEYIFGYVLPIIQHHRHLILIHDIIDVRHHPHLRDYKQFGIWKGYWEGEKDGPYVIMNSMASAFEEVIPLNDFAQRNSVKMHSVENEVREKIFNRNNRATELIRLLGEEMASPTSSFHWLSLNDRGRSAPLFFPKVHYRSVQKIYRPAFTTSSATKPMVSIITPCFNSVRYLTDCIESVLSQDYPNVEHIIQDGVSNDGTIDILKRYSKHKYRNKIKWVSESDNGQSDGLNKAIQRSHGDILLVLNADDMLLPNACSWGVEELNKHPDWAVVYGDEYIIDENGNIVSFFTGKHDYTYERLFCVELVPPAQAAFIRRSMFEQVGLFADISLSTCPDFEMWLRIGARYRMQHVFGPVCKYRHHQESEGRQPQMVDAMVTSKRSVIDRILSDSKTAPAIKKLKIRAYAGLNQWAATSSHSIGAYRKELFYLWKSFVLRPQLHKAIRIFRLLHKHSFRYFMNQIPFMNNSVVK